MRLCSLELDKKHVIFEYAVNCDTEAESKKGEECPEAPLPELNEAFNSMAPIVCRIFGWQKEYAVGISVYRLAMSYTKHGTRSVVLKFTKSIESTGGEPFKMATPSVRIDPPSDGENGKQEVTESDREAIKALIFECERYIGGDRSQQLLNFKEAKAALQATADKGADLLSGIGG